MNEEANAVEQEDSEIRRQTAYGHSLKSRRKERGLKRVELSQRTGISAKEIEKAEQGSIELNEDQKLRIKKFLRRQRIV